MTAADSNEQASTILHSLAKVRQRLYIVRLAERAALSLAVAGAVAVPLVGARLIAPRYPWLADVLAALPLAAAAWLVMCARPLADPAKNLARRAALTAPLLRLAAALIAVLVLAAFLILCLPQFHAAPLWILAAFSGAVFLAAAIATVRPVQPRTAAIFVDQHVGLEERVATALELLHTQPASRLESAFRAPVIASAVDACQTIRGAKVHYARIDRRVYALAATTIIAAVGVSLLNPLPALAVPTIRHYAPVAEKGSTLAQKLNELEAKQKVTDPALAKKLAELRKVAESMKQGTMSPFEANQQLSTLEQQMKNEQQKQNNAADVQQAMEASKDLQDVAKASDQVKSAAQHDAASNSPGSQMQHDNASASVKSAAKSLGDKLAGMSEKDKKDLASQLQKASDQSSDPQTKKDLGDAAKAASQGNAGQMEKSLADAGNRVGQQGAQQQMSSEQAREAMNQIERAQGDGMSQGEQESQSGSGSQGGDAQQQQQAGGQQGGNQQSGGQKGGGQQAGGQQAGGQQGGKKSGGGQQGGGNQQGGQQGNGGSQANGQQQESDGNGSTNFHTPGGPGSKHNNAPIGGTGTFVQVYGQKSIDSRGQMVGAQGHINPLGIPSGTVQTLSHGDKTDSQIKSYQDELPAARKKALDDLSTQAIPPQDKDLIRAYYDK